MGIDTIAITGMQTSMTDLEVISNNIANSNTVGFKKSYANFADLYPTNATNTTPGLGTSLSSIRQDFSSGGVQTTDQLLDLSINSSSFFMLRDPGTGQTSYTRAGRFNLDNNGFILENNQRLQGFPSVNGQLLAPSIVDLQVPSAPLPAQATSTASGSINLDADAVVPTAPFSNTDATTYNFATNTTVFDSLGNPEKLTMYYVKSGANAWNVNAEVNGTAVGTGTLTFSSSGALTGTTGLSALSYTTTSGAASPQVISVSLANSTQYGGNGSQVVQPFAQNGFESGTVTGMNIDSNGVVTAQYSNSQVQTVGQIALASFESPDNLQNIGNSSWIATTASGSPNISQSNSSGNIFTGSVELSNVDLTEELVNLIGAQHAFQANAQVEQTYNEVMQTVMKII
jgi:flagellar hook protein FlgE